MPVNPSVYAKSNVVGGVVDAHLPVYWSSEVHGLWSLIYGMCGELTVHLPGLDCPLSMLVSQCP